MTTTTASTNSDSAKPSFACQPVGADFFATAPLKFVTKVEVDVEPMRLFEILDDETSWPVWVKPGIERVTWTTPRPHGVGATRTVRMLGGIDIHEHFFTWDPGREIAFYLTGMSQEIWARFAERYEIAETEPGKCRLTWTVAYEPARLARVQRLTNPLMALAFKLYVRNLAKYCRKLAK